MVALARSRAGRKDFVEPPQVLVVRRHQMGATQPVQLDPVLERAQERLELPALGAGLVLGVAVVLGLAAFQPDTFRVERAITIKAPPEKIEVCWNG